jgi:hypothetical protein
MKQKNNMNSRLVNINKDDYDVLITRTTKWGNPYSHREGTNALYIVSSRNEAIECYKEYITIGEGKHLLNDLDELKGKTLGCVCLPKKCHGEVLLELINDKKIKGLFK